jgi:hypothetical protein
MKRETENLSFAAFCHMHGLRVIKGAEARSVGKVVYRFTFDDSDSRWDELCILFANSEAARYDNAVRQLKLLCKHSS